MFMSDFSTASDVTYGAKTAHMCARSLSEVRILRIFSFPTHSLDARSTTSSSRSTSNHTQNMNKELMYYTPKHEQNLNKELLYYFHEVDSKYQGFYCVMKRFDS